MIPKFDKNGNLPEGIIKPKLSEFKVYFVNGFKKSNTRTEIFNGYLEYCSKIFSLDVASLQWVNGSFTTNKINPNDIDFVTHVDAIKLDNSIEQEQKSFDKLCDHEKSKNEFNCDSYFIFLYPQEYSDLYQDTLNQIEYWSKWFSQDRKKRQKGLIEFDLSDNSFDIGRCKGCDGS